MKDWLFDNKWRITFRNVLAMRRAQRYGVGTTINGAQVGFLTRVRIRRLRK